MWVKLENLRVPFRFPDSVRPKNTSWSYGIVLLYPDNRKAWTNWSVGAENFRGLVVSVRVEISLFDAKCWEHWGN
jgi:hypothetical protein